MSCRYGIVRRIVSAEEVTFGNSQTQVTIQQSTLTSLTLEKDKLTEEKAALEHKCVAIQSQINSLEVGNPL